ncbi:phosphatase domain-containing protein [Frigidibacter oleivorans]|uniref:phosphatase domain-containing protein n=1 Tax=Frigidibacter oleivorans TaxID=2487129 RepID=UPI0013DF1F39|nr:tyrosine-protein phosphatase [Frigidibacter oleivorans]
MFARLKKPLKRLERRLNDPAHGGIDTAGGRRRNLLHFHLMDHAFLRVLWTNFAKVADGVYRSNQPSPGRMGRYKARGIRTVINLRGDQPLSYYLFEREAAERLGLTMIDTRLFAKKLPRPESLIELERIFRRAEKPFVMHCKSGSDRAGFASALYLMMIENRPVEEAARQLHWRFLHLKTTRTGVLDHFLRCYDRAHRATGIGLMDWVRTGYDPRAVTQSFKLWLKDREGWDRDLPLPAPRPAAAPKPAPLTGPRP